MPGLRDHAWRTFYGPADDRLHDFYIPALSRSIAYDRSAGFFTSTALAIAATGLAHLIRAGGRMRLLVGAQLSEADVRAVEEGYDLRARVEAGLLRALVDPTDYLTTERLKALAWMIARGTLDIRVVLPVDRTGKPIHTGPHDPYFHIKTGVFTDYAGDQVAFTGSVNESETAWVKNYEDLSVYTSWITPAGDSRAHLRGVVQRFDRLWADREADWKALPVPQAVLDRLIVYAPAGPPTRDPAERGARDEDTRAEEAQDQDERILVQFVRDAPRLPGARGLGAATSTLRPWPHQARVADTVTSRYPEGFLLCDEVGLGKTIEAGLILRQLVLDGRVSRALILTPRSVLRQFQEELYEKFVLSVPIFDGRVFHHPDGRVEAPTTANAWDSHDLFMASSQLAKRRDRRAELLGAKPFDLIIVDEAHHARRRDFGNLDQLRPNNLLRLLDELRHQERVQCLLLMTATPLQVHPVEVFDLLRLLGLGGRWGAHHANFLRFFAELRKPSIADIDWLFVLRMVRDAQQTGVRLPDAFARAAERQVGPVAWHVIRALPESREVATSLAQLSPEAKKVALAMVRQLTPLRTLVQRSTRELLRAYRAKGILKEAICRRDPQPVWIAFTPEEARLYAEVERYVAEFYKRYEARRAGLGFVMTVYRRRLTSSFYALQESLTRRLDYLKGQRADLGLDDDDTEQDDLDLDVAEDIEDTAAALHDEEIEFVEKFLEETRSLRADSKLERLHADMKEVLKQRETVLVFTQYTDTMDYLRNRLKDVYGSQVACYSGRGGELWDGTVWKSVSKEDLKALFKTAVVKILLGTEAMSEGLNLQTCGVLINFDMPWNPMRVEQRIGRIDRIGQIHDVVWVRNYFYDQSVEALVYRRLQDRIDWFETVVGHLQPILSQVGRVIQDLSMTAAGVRRERIDAQLRALEVRIQEEEAAGLRLDDYVDLELTAEEENPIPVPADALEHLLVRSSRWGRLFQPHSEIEGAYIFDHEGSKVAVTFNQRLFDQHPNTLKLLTYGEPILTAFLARWPAPIVGDTGNGRLIRSEAPSDRLVAYYRPSDEQPIEAQTMTDLHAALGAPARSFGPDQQVQADAQLRERAELSRARARGVREELAVGDYLARQEEARIVLRRATSVNLALHSVRPPELFDDTAPEVHGAAPTTVRDFARAKGYPYAPLLRLLDNEEVRLSLTDPYFVALGNRPEKSLRGLEQSLREQAHGILARLTAARDRLASIRSEVEPADVRSVVLR